VDAIAATIAVPDWFEPVTVGNGPERQSLFGGCIGFNNLTWEALLEAKEIFGTNGRVTSLFSVGARKMASAPPASSGEEIDDRSKRLDEMVADCEQTSRRLSGYFRDLQAYVRFNMEGHPSDVDIVDWDDSTNMALNERAISYTDKVEVENDLVKAVANLLQETGTVTLGQLST
jgi:hypothetical protein